MLWLNILSEQKQRSATFHQHRLSKWRKIEKHSSKSKSAGRFWHKPVATIAMDKHWPRWFRRTVQKHAILYIYRIKMVLELIDWCFECVSLTKLIIGYYSQYQSMRVRVPAIASSSSSLHLLCCTRSEADWRLWWLFASIFLDEFFHPPIHTIKIHIY